jgi:hypothetical protein
MESLIDSKSRLAAGHTACHFRERRRLAGPAEQAAEKRYKADG